MKKLRNDGWMVSRSAMSHGPVDVFAAKDGVVRLIQVKSGSSRMKKGEVEILKSWGITSTLPRKSGTTKKEENYSCTLSGIKKLFPRRLLSLLRVPRFFLEAPHDFHFFMASLTNGFLFLAGRLEEVRLFVLDFVTKIASEFQIVDARRLKIEVLDSLK